VQPQAGKVPSGDLDDVPVTQPKQRKAKAPKGSLEAVSGSSSDESDDEDKLPPEYAVLDLTVPRTALVINVSHVLKRLNGCCSLNQLNKALKCFKEKTGVTLETFLRANPMTFKLEGRIVYLVDRDGAKWKNQQQEEQHNETAEQPTKGKSKGKEQPTKGTSKGKAEEQPTKGKSKGKAEEQPTKGKGKASKQQASQAASQNGGSWEGEETGKKPRRRGGKKAAAAGADYEWSSHGWDEWSAAAWKGDGRGAWSEWW